MQAILLPLSLCHNWMRKVCGPPKECDIQKQTSLYCHIHSQACWKNTNPQTYMYNHGSRSKKKVLLIFSQESLHLACPCEPTIGIRLARNSKENICTWKLLWLLFDHSMSNCRVVTKISSCRANTTSRWGIKWLGISFGSIFLLFSNKSSRGPLS